ncbi:hypothetical protein BGX31_005432 [Mortierella sp. GBA43]|nr:hypothetical protein BGX31_005432 [Mortierella sp. GBA43]
MNYHDLDHIVSHRFSSTLEYSTTATGRLTTIELRNCTGIRPQLISNFLRSQLGLEHLVLGGNSITDEALDSLIETPLVRLQSLELIDCGEISDETMVPVMYNCDLITKLVIFGSCFTLRTFSAISQYLPRLEELHLERVPLIMNESLQDILTKCSRLRILKLWHCRNLTQDLFTDDQTQCETLEELEYMDNFQRQYKINDSMQVRFLTSIVTRFEKLKILRLAKLGDSSTSLNLVSYLCQLDQLEKFTLLQNPGLDCANLKELKQKLPMLTHIGVGISDQTSEGELLKFATTNLRPGVQIQHVIQDVHQQSLGQALLVLFQSNRAAIRRAFTDILGESVLSVALRRVISHVAISNDDSQQSLTVRMQEVTTPLLDKILKRSDEAGRKVAFFLLDWLILESPQRIEMALALSRELEPRTDKKRKLAALLAIEHSLQTHSARHSAQKTESIASDPGSENGDLFDGDILTTWISLLSNIIHEDSVAVPSITRLVSLALDLSMFLSRILSIQVLRDIEQEKVLRRQALVTDVSDLGTAGTEYSSTHGRAFTECMLDIINILQTYQLASKSVVFALYDALSLNLDKADYEGLVAQLTSTLDVPTEIPSDSLDMVVKYTMLFPDVLIPELLKRIQQVRLEGKPSFQGTATAPGTANVISVVIRLRDEEFFLRALPSEAEHQRRLLEEAIVELLQGYDADTKRMNNITLALEPRKVFDILAPKLTSDDTGTRSWARSAMIEYILYQRLSGSTFNSFVDYTRRSQSVTSQSNISYPWQAKKIRTPTQLLSMVRATSSNTTSCKTGEEMQEALFNVFKKLGEHILPTSWNNFLNILISKTCALPADHHLVRVWNNLGPSLVKSPEATLCLSKLVLGRMEQQGSVTEQILEDALETSDDALEDLRLARLSPLLILKSIPIVGLTQEFKRNPCASEDNIPDRMSRALRVRFDNQLEFSVVRTMAKAAHYGMHPDSALEAIYSGMARCFTNKPVDPSRLDLIDIRSWLFTLYDWVAKWAIDACTPEELEHSIAWIYRIISEDLFAILSLHNTNQGITQDLYKAQLGATDILSKFLLVTGPYYLSPEKDPCHQHPKVSKKNETTSLGEKSDHILPRTPKELLVMILEESLNRITCTITERRMSHVAHAVCLINAFIMAFQSVTSLTSASLSTSASRKEPLEAMRQDEHSKSWIRSVLLDLVAPRLSAVVVQHLQEQGDDENKEMVPIIQGCIQLLYTGVSVLGILGESVTSHPMWNVAVKGLDSEAAAIAIASLKLLATMLGTRMAEPSFIAQGDMEAIQNNLQRLQTGERETPSAELLDLLDKVRAMLS